MDKVPMAPRTPVVVFVLCLPLFILTRFEPFFPSSQLGLFLNQLSFQDSCLILHRVTVHSYVYISRS